MQENITLTRTFSIVPYEEGRLNLLVFANP